MSTGASVGSCGEISGGVGFLVFLVDGVVDVGISVGTSGFGTGVDVGVNVRGSEIGVSVRMGVSVGKDGVTVARIGVGLKLGKITVGVVLGGISVEVAVNSGAGVFVNVGVELGMMGVTSGT